MADQFEEAPPLPRGLTDISVAHAAEDGDDVEQSNVRDALPPPPKFPSLTDVGAPVTQSTIIPEAPDFSSEPAPGATETDSATDSPVATATDNPLDDDDDLQSPDHDALHEDIMAAIQRDAVEPGTGARRAVEIGRELWTNSDQEELDRLLAEGQDVYVPPDVGVADLPVARASGYAYVPIPPPDAGVDASPDQRSMADRIAIWNQVVPQEHSSPPSSGYFAAVAAGSGAGAAAAASASAAAASDAADAGETTASRSAPTDYSYAQAESAVESSVAEPVDYTPADSAPATPVPPSRMETPVRSMGVADDEMTPAKTPQTPAKVTNADVSKSIFGGSFYTVPVVSRKYTQVDKMTVANTADSQPATTQDVLLKANSSASVKVLDDYGLKGGHDTVINDAAFMHADQTLITCGADGKVCIWDMSDRSVQREFVPYEGEPVTMVYPLPDDGEPTSTIMTLSESRTMRIWCVDETQAVMLRSNQIKTSESDLYMSVPVISKQLKARAIAAAAAAAVRTTDTFPEEVNTVAPDAPEAPDCSAVASPASASTQPTSPVPSIMTPPSTSKTAGSVERVRASPKDGAEDETRKRFSLNKMFGGRSRGRAVAG